MKHSKGIVTIPNITGDIDVNVNIEILPIELYSGDASKYSLNTAMDTSNFTVSALNNRYLTDVIPVDFTRRQCIHIVGARDGYEGGHASLYKIILYKSGVASNLVWASNFYPNHDSYEGYANLSNYIDNLDSYDGIQFEIGAKGAGSSLSAGDILSTNDLSIQLCAHISADITDRVGYTVGKSLGLTTDQTEITVVDNSWYATTGIIDVIAGDIIRIKGLQWIHMDSNSSCSISFYNKDGSYAGKMRQCYNGYGETSGITYKYYCSKDDGMCDIIEIHISDVNNHEETNYFTTAGIAICGRYDRESEIIITKNLEIEHYSDNTLFNMLPYATGTTSGKGYDSNCNIDGNGNAITLSGVCSTGFIRTNKYNDIYIKNITEHSDIGVNRIFFYNESKVKTYHTNFSQSASTYRYRDGIYRVRPASLTDADIHYMRLSCGSITDDTIITVGDEMKDYTNLARPSGTNKTDTSLWVNNYHISGASLFSKTTTTSTTISNFIACEKGDVIRIYGATLKEDFDRLLVYVSRADTGAIDTAEGYFQKGVYSGDIPIISYNGIEGGIYTFTVEDDYGGDIIGFRFSMNTPLDPNNVIVTINEHITYPKNNILSLNRTATTSAKYYDSYGCQDYYINPATYFGITVGTTPVTVTNLTSTSITVQDNVGGYGCGFPIAIARELGLSENRYGKTFLFTWNPTGTSNTRLYLHCTGNDNQTIVQIDISGNKSSCGIIVSEDGNSMMVDGVIYKSNGKPFRAMSFYFGSKGGDSATSYTGISLVQLD